MTELSTNNVDRRVVQIGPFFYAMPTDLLEALEPGHATREVAFNGDPATEAILGSRCKALLAAALPDQTWEEVPTNTVIATALQRAIQARLSETTPEVPKNSRISTGDFSVYVAAASIRISRTPKVLCAQPFLLHDPPSTASHELRVELMNVASHGALWVDTFPLVDGEELLVDPDHLPRWDELRRACKLATMPDPQVLDLVGVKIRASVLPRGPHGEDGVRFVYVPLG